MGGYGSGRYGQKAHMEQQLRIDIRYLKKNRLLEPGSYTLIWSCGDEDSVARASLIVRDQKVIVACKWIDGETGTPQKMNRVITLSETPCRYGGSRKWLICPRCRQRMAVLVLTPPSVGCRHCLDLVYTSQNENVSYRGLRKMNKIADRLQRGEYFEEMLLRPKGMHKRTYDRLVEEYDKADTQSMHWIVARMRMLE